MLLEGQSVIVTGGSSGIGRAAALECAKQGARIVIGHIGTSEAANDATSLMRQIDGLGREAVSVGGDAARPETAQHLVEVAVEQFGGLDVMINSAGVCPFHSFLDLPHEVYRETVAVNLDGAFYAVQAAARQMQFQGRGGAIVAVSSISALVGGSMQVHYTPTKAGVLSLMRSCAAALGSERIRCNAVLPGTIETELNRQDLSDPNKRKYMIERTPLGRLGEPQDLAGPIVFLASDMAKFVTGASLLVDGGLYVNLQ